MLLSKTDARCGCGRFTIKLDAPEAFTKIGAHERTHTMLAVDVS